MKTEALKGQIWQVPYLVAELLKCYERERVCYPKFRKALKGQAHEVRLAAKLLGESVTGRNIIGKMCKIKWVGKVLAGQQEEKPCHAGANAGWRLVDRCFGRGVYARMRRMKTEALKGQIWQVPYLAAYWFWRGRTVIRIIWGIIFRTISGLLFGLFRTMRNNVYLRRDRK